MELMAPSAARWSHAQGDTGVLVLHGFTGNPTSMRPLAEHLAAEGHRVELPRLPGHGTSWKDLASTAWSDWADEAAAAFDRLGPRPRAIVGLSMGGTLALHLAQQRPRDVGALVLINPWMTLHHPLKPTLRVLQHVIGSFPGVGNDIARPDADELPYPRVPLTALSSVLEAQGGVRDRLSEVRAPTLVLTSRVDHTIDPEDSTLIVRELRYARTQQVRLEHSFHVATLDYDAELIADRASAWIADALFARPSDSAPRR
jgi:carboxylesterase